MLNNVNNTRGTQSTNIATPSTAQKTSQPATTTTPTTAGILSDTSQSPAQGAAVDVASQASVSDIIGGDTNVPGLIKQGHFTIDDIAAALIYAMTQKENKLTNTINQLNGANSKTSVNNNVAKSLQNSLNQLDPTKPGATVDISKATVQVPGDGTNPAKTISLVNYLKDSGITIKDPTKANSTEIQGAMTSLKTDADTQSSSQQTMMITLQKDAGELERITSMCSALVKSLGDMLQGVIQKTG